MGFDLQTSVSALTVFFQGLLSFFSPCVLPLVPLYLSYLAGGAPEAALDKAARRRTLLNTFFFVLGISFAFFLLGMGFTVADGCDEGTIASVVSILRSRQEKMG